MKAGNSLRILHLEDNPNDRELVRKLLEREGIACIFTYACSKPEFQMALEQTMFDLIFSDFTLPGYGGMEALSLAKTMHPEVPYLFVSGTIGEKRAIESLKSGATDYVLKEHLEQLVPSLRRALREAEERSKRKKAEEALKRAEEKFRGIFENAVEGIFQSSPEGRYIIVNPAMAHIFGYESPDQLLRTPENLGHRHCVAPVRHAEFEQALIESGQVLGFESQVTHKGGGAIWVSTNARIIRDVHGGAPYYEGSVEDITGRKLAEAALRESELRFREMSENIRDVFWVISPDAQELLYISPAYETIWGRSITSLQAQPTSWMEAVVPADRPQVQAALAQLALGKEFRVEYRIHSPDGTERWIEARGYPVFNPDGKVERGVGSATDISQRKRLESELRQIQKMESIGQLAGGIAHDFNNALTVITGHVYLLLDKENLDAETLQSLREIHAAGEHAAKLTNQLLVFSRKQTMLMQLVNLNEIVSDTSNMLRRLVGERIAVELDLPTKPTIVMADTGMLEQILVNLAVNARDAMSQKYGKLTIKTQQMSVEAATMNSNSAARSGEFICLSVEDTGCGIAPDILPRIFEPFFTTKDEGKGTGLGLATIFGIAKQHHGWVEVKSQIGVGTIFKIYFPMPKAEINAVKSQSGEGKVRGGTEAILLVEDEAPVRELAAAVLKRLGYRVLQAASGDEAMEVWHWHKERIRLLLTDVVMPGDMTGMDLAEKLCQEKPTLKVIYGSGYSDAIAGQVFPHGGKDHFLQKPYQPRTLAKAVRDMLDG